MPIYVADEIADTAHLSAEDVGAYFLLRAYYWRTGLPLPNNRTTLAQISRLSPGKFKRAWGLISAFFELQDGHWHHDILDREIEKAVKNVEKKRQAGRAGGKAKALADATAHATADGMTTGLAKSCQTHAPSPSPSPVVPYQEGKVASSSYVSVAGSEVDVSTGDVVKICVEDF